MLAAAVQKATESFIVQGETIAYQNPEIRNEMLLAVDDVKKTGLFKNVSHCPLGNINSIIMSAILIFV